MGALLEELPESGVVGAAPAPGDATYDVLLLGGSVLHRVVEHRGPELAERLAGATGREVRLYDLARPGRAREALRQLRPAMLDHPVQDAAAEEQHVVRRVAGRRCRPDAGLGKLFEEPRGSSRSRTSPTHPDVGSGPFEGGGAATKAARPSRLAILKASAIRLTTAPSRPSPPLRDPCRPGRRG